MVARGGRSCREGKISLRACVARCVLEMCGSDREGMPALEPTTRPAQSGNPAPMAHMSVPHDELIASSPNYPHPLSSPSFQSASPVSYLRH
jgi:hypothetical protein